MKRLTGHLYFWVLIAILAGGLLGHFAPKTGASLKPLGDGFIALAATLVVVPSIPVADLALILGNGVATVVVSKWENELDRDKMALAMAA